MNQTRDTDFPANFHDGEKVIVRGVVSPAIFWKALGILLFALLLAVIALPLGIFMAFIALLTFIYAALLKHFMLLVVTNERIFFRSGLVKIDTVQVRLDRVESVEIQRTLVGHALKYGTVVLTGTGTRFAYIPYLGNAVQVRNIIDEMLYRREKAAGKAVEKVDEKRDAPSPA